MVANDPQKTAGSSKVLAVVGEIDTSAPFQSVKDAVNLFGQGAFSREKPPAIKKAKPFPAELNGGVLAKETQLQLVQKELNKLKHQIKNAEATKAQALSDLEKVKKTVEDLTCMLKRVSESKDSAIKATETAKTRAKQIEAANNLTSNGTYDSQKQEVETSSEEYVAVIAELDVAKQELRKNRYDCGASEDAKGAAVKQEADDKLATKEYLEKASELSNEIIATRESIEQVKLANLQTQEEEAKIYAEKDHLKQSYKVGVEVLSRKLIALKEAIDPVLTETLESKLADTESQFDQVLKEMDNTKTSDLDSLKSIATELDEAKELLKKVTEEENSLRMLLETLKTELEGVKKEQTELKLKEAESEFVVGNQHVKLRKAKSEFEATLVEETKIQGASLQMLTTLQQFSLESETARRDAVEMNKQAEDLNKEAEHNRILLEETDKKLNSALHEVEDTKEAEIMALEKVKVLSERTDAARASSSDSGSHITMSKDEYESLSGKVKECEKLSGMKVAAAIAQVEAVKASENEVLKKLDATRKEIDDLKAATQEALKQAEMAKTAKKVVEGELKRWREREQKKIIEAASKILIENDASLTSSPLHYRIQKQQNHVAKPPLRAKTSVSKKALFHSISGIFVRKKNQVKGSSPS